MATLVRRRHDALLDAVALQDQIRASALIEGFERGLKSFDFISFGFRFRIFRCVWRQHRGKVDLFECLAIDQRARTGYLDVVLLERKIL